VLELQLALLQAGYPQLIGHLVTRQQRNRGIQVAVFFLNDDKSVPDGFGRREHLEKPLKGKGQFSHPGPAQSSARRVERDISWFVRNACCCVKPDTGRASHRKGVFMKILLWII